MKKFLVAAVFGLAGLAAFAGTCVITNISLTTIGSHDTFAGELQNDSGANILQHSYLVAFLDSGNNVVDTKTVPGCLRSLQNGTSDFFSATSGESSSTTVTGLARLAFDSSFKVGNTAEGDVTISNLSITRSGSSLHITGKIKNNDSDKLFDPRACVVVRDSDDRIIIVGRSDILNDIDTDQSTTFDVTITVPSNSTTVNRVDVFVDGLDGASDGAPIAPASDINNSVTVCGATATATNTTVPTNTSTATATTTPVSSPTATNTAAATSTPTSTPCG